jgi:hypothetical protein
LGFVTDGDDGLHLKFDQLSGQSGKAITLALGESPLNDEILAFRVTQLLESRREQHGYAASVRRGRPHDLREDSDSVHFPQRLGPPATASGPARSPPPTIATNPLRSITGCLEETDGNAAEARGGLVGAGSIPCRSLLNRLTGV